MEAKETGKENTETGEGRLGLDHHQAVYNQVGPVSAIDARAVVDERQGFLRFESKPCLREFKAKAREVQEKNR